MYSAEVDPIMKPKILKAPLGKHIIMDLDKVGKSDQTAIETYDDWLKAHRRVDELNKGKNGKQYGVFNDEGKKTRGPEDINLGLQQEKE